MSANLAILSVVRHQIVTELRDTDPMSHPLVREQARVRATLCVGSWLPASETFVYDQLKHQAMTRVRVIAGARTKHALRFPYEDVVHLGAAEKTAYYHFGWNRSVLRALREHRTQVVHAHFGPNGTMVLRSARRLGIPLVVSFHGHDVGGLLPQNRRTLRYGRYQQIAPELFEYASYLVCASSELADRLVDVGAPREKIIIHQLGVDVDFFSPSPGRPRAADILIVGRLVEKKGIFDGISAFSKICSRFPAARLRIVGEGPLRSALLSRVRALHLEDRITFCGPLGRERILEEMRRAALLLTPSFETRSGDRESGVIVIKEAGSTGLPVVATRHGGIPEIVQDERTGLLVSERDIEGLGAALSKLLESEILRARLGSAARERVLEHYDTRRQNRRLEGVLVQAAMSGPRA